MGSKASSDSSVKSSVVNTSVADSYNQSSNTVFNTSGSYNTTDSGGNVYIGDVASKAVPQLESSATSAANNMGSLKIPLLVLGAIVVLFVVLKLIRKN
jgi:hypothetical protein